MATSIHVHRQLAELEQIARRLHVRISYEPMHGVLQGSGGLCRVRGEYRIIMDRRLKPGDRLQVLAGALRGLDASDVAMTEEAEALLGRAAPRTQAGD